MLSFLSLPSRVWGHEENYENYHSLRHIFNDLLGIFLNQQTLLSSYCWQKKKEKNGNMEQETFDNFSFHLLEKRLTWGNWIFFEKGTRKNRNKLLRGTIMNFNVINERLKWLISVKKERNKFKRTQELSIIWERSQTSIANKNYTEDRKRWKMIRCRNLNAGTTCRSDTKLQAIVKTVEKNVLSLSKKKRKKIKNLTFSEEQLNYDV